MFDFATLRLLMPTSYVLAERKRHMILRVDGQREMLYLEVDSAGMPGSDLPYRAVSYRLQTLCRYECPGKADLWHAELSPKNPRWPVYIGVKCSRDEAACYLDTTTNDADRMLADGYREFIIAPCGIVTPFDFGDKIAHPSLFGLQPAQPRRAA